MHYLTACNCSLLLQQASAWIMMARNCKQHCQCSYGGMYVVLENIHMYYTLYGTSLVMYNVHGCSPHFYEVKVYILFQWNYDYSLGIVTLIRMIHVAILTNQCLQGSSYIIQNVKFLLLMQDIVCSKLKKSSEVHSKRWRPCLVMNKNYSNNILLINYFTFLNKQALQGCGMHIEIHQHIQQQQCHIDTSLFADNK